MFCFLKWIKLQNILPLTDYTDHFMQQRKGKAYKVIKKIN